jgi:HlyD family secretion protein
LFTIATDLAHLQVQVNVDQADVGGIQVGQIVTFEVESYPDETFSGVVSQVRLQPIAEQSTPATTVATSTIGQQTTSVATVVSYATMIDVDNPDERLRPGMTASVVLSGLQHANVPRVPNAAVSFHPSADVFKALKESDPSAKARELWTYDGKTLTPHLAQYGLSDQEWTELVKSGLRPGDRVVTSASFFHR